MSVASNGGIALMDERHSGAVVRAVPLSAGRLWAPFPGLSSACMEFASSSCACVRACVYEFSPGGHDGIGPRGSPEQEKQ